MARVSRLWRACRRFLKPLYVLAVAIPLSLTLALGSHLLGHWGALEITRWSWWYIGFLPAKHLVTLPRGADLQVETPAYDIYHVKLPSLAGDLCYCVCSCNGPNNFVPDWERPFTPVPKSFRPSEVTLPFSALLYVPSFWAMVLALLTLLTGPYQSAWAAAVDKFTNDLGELYEMEAEGAPISVLTKQRLGLAFLPPVVFMVVLTGLAAVTAGIIAIRHRLK